MSKEEVRIRLEEMVASGQLCSKRSTGMNYSDIKRAIGCSELYATSFENIVARSRDIRDEFEGFIREGSVMNTPCVMAHTGLTTAYKINLACAEGDLIRFSKLGKGCILFIA